MVKNGPQDDKPAVIEFLSKERKTIKSESLNSIEALVKTYVSFLSPQNFIRFLWFV